MSTKSISGIKNAVRKSVQHSVSSISIRNSVSDVENVRRTVGMERLPELSSIRHQVDNDLCIKCGACKDNCNFNAVYVEM